MRSINQVRHFYVTLSNTTDIPTEKGAIQVVTKDNTLMFKYMSPGGLVGTDKIDVNKIMYGKYTPAADMATTLKTAEITPLANPVVGQEYIIKVTFNNYAGGGDDNITVKYGFATAKTDSVSDLLVDLAISLAKNMNDIVPLASVNLVTTDDTMREVKATDTVKDHTGTYTDLIIEEVEQPWTVGVQPFKITPFTVTTFPIVKDGVETAWTNEIKTLTPQADATVIGNGKKIADMEWFHTGARGDYYRGYGNPHGVTAELLADSTKAYDTIDIHYAYVGPNEGVQKSEKDITIAGETAVITAINNALADANIPGFTTID